MALCSSIWNAPDHQFSGFGRRGPVAEVARAAVRRQYPWRFLAKPASELARIVKAIIGNGWWMARGKLEESAE